MQIELNRYKAVLDRKYILIATSNSKEKDAINRMISFRRNIYLEIEHKGCYIGLIEDVFVIHLSGTSGMADKPSISRIVIEFLSKENLPRPECVLLIGFCWGNPNKTTIGSIIFSDSVLSLNSDKVENGKILYKGINLRSNLSLELLQSEITACIPKSLFGTLASKERLFSDTKQRDLLLEEFPEILGGEMEAFGFIPNVDNNNWLIIKTVSDFGDNEYNRETQVEAANVSADIIPNFISILKNHEIIFECVNDDSSKVLIDILIGNTLKIYRGNISPENLNDFLNNKIGPLIDYKLEYFLTGAEYDDFFVYYFCNLLLEMTQNSFRYGHATEVEISFSSSSIIFSDNGDFFDVSQITGDKGGADAWRNVKSNFLEKDFVDFEIKKKKICFNLKMIDLDLQKIIKECSVSIKRGTIGSPYESKSILEYNNECSSVFVNDIANRMSSRRLTIIHEVKKLLENGLKVYVIVRSESEAEKYRSFLSDHEENLKMIIKN